MSKTPRQAPKTLIAYYSRTGTTETVAETLSARFRNPDIERIQPRTSRSYPNWLVRSCIPNWDVPLKPLEYDPSSYDAVFIGAPKWTVNCPPISRYINRVSLDGQRVGLFITFGGFDEHRYARQLTRKIRARGGHVSARLLVKRDEASTLPAENVHRFIDSVLDPA